MKDLLIVGVDVSKSTLDFHCKPNDLFFQTENTIGGFRVWLKKITATSLCKLLVVMEHTGSYSLKFESFLRSKGIDYCKIPALEIKRSLGVIRGKSDKVDAARIAEYAWLRKDLLTADAPLEEGTRKLRNLLSLRAKLVRDRSGYMCRIKEMKHTQAWTKSDVEIIIQESMIKKISSDILRLEKEIRSAIKANHTLQTTFELITTIKGVGLIVAAYMIASTNNFKRFKNARKFNCYAGLAPFSYQSGTSIKGRARVSHLANKEAKTLLNLAASSAIQYDKEMKEYYEKRTTEGMKGMSCLNIIRSKIVARMFAVVKRQSPYVELTTAA